MSNTQLLSVLKTRHAAFHQKVWRRTPQTSKKSVVLLCIPLYPTLT